MYDGCYFSLSLATIATLYCQSFKILTILVGVLWYIFVLLVCVLVSNNAGIVPYAYRPFIFFLSKVSVQMFFPSVIGLLVFLLFIYRSCLYILILLIFLIQVLWKYSPSMSYLSFYLFISLLCLWWAEKFYFNEVQFINFLWLVFSMS